MRLMRFALFTFVPSWLARLQKDPGNLFRFLALRSIVAGATLYGAADLLATPAYAAAPQPAPGVAGATQLSFSAVAGSVKPITDVTTGAFSSPKMSIEVVLAPRNATQLSSLLATVTNPKSRSYGQWLKTGQFNAMFAPSASQTATVSRYLQANGLALSPSASPFFLRASGSSHAIEAALRTTLRTYRNARGIKYFSNASAVQLPRALMPSIIGVVGLSSTVHFLPQYKLALQRHPAKSHLTASSAQTSCEEPYPTVPQLFAFFLQGASLPFGYGGGPGCQGLTPSQDNSIYGAPNLGSRGKGAGVNLAVFELSAYQHSDIQTWVHQFYGPHFTAPLIDINVDGGPLNPGGPCLTNSDFCPASFNGYSGDIEVDADIETQLAISPAASHILVYNAPNDLTGQTTIDEYAQIANDNLADVVSASWGICENDQLVANAQAENLIFEQMALQGQSMFTAAGDTGAFDCIRANNTNVVNTEDPATQPWVTGVGGTSFESFNPGTNPHPAYPTGVETVWNVGDLCNASPDEGGATGFFWCAAAGAGGGGNSQFWGRPYFQFGPGLTNAYTQQCALAATATPCRAEPDISANADEFTPYAEYCTGTSALPYSNCATFSFAQDPPGWFGIGGTSLSSPLWSAIIADRDSFQGTRTGNAMTLLYLLYSVDPHAYFNDITGIGQTTNNNGLFPTVPGYDLATGIGTPKMTPIITGFP